MLVILILISILLATCNFFNTFCRIDDKSGVVVKKDGSFFVERIFLYVPSIFYVILLDLENSNGQDGL